MPVDGSRVRAYIGLGANLGQPLATLEAACREIGGIPGVSITAQSSWYRSAPVDATGPDFVNGVLAVDTSLDPHALLAALQAIESRHGRERPYRNAPRTLDLDLLLHGANVLDEPALTLPHPRMHTRAFVLAPLAQIAPGAVVPGHGAAADLLQVVGDQDVSLLEPQR